MSFVEISEAGEEMDKILSQIESYYSVDSNSCADTPSEALKAVNKASGTKTQELFSNKEGAYHKVIKKNPIPHFRYRDIQRGNPNGYEYDLNRMRKVGDPNSWKYF